MPTRNLLIAVCASGDVRSGRANSMRRPPSIKPRVASPAISRRSGAPTSSARQPTPSRLGLPWSNCVKSWRVASAAGSRPSSEARCVSHAPITVTAGARLRSMRSGSGNRSSGGTRSRPISTAREERFCGARLHCAAVDAANRRQFLVVVRRSLHDSREREIRQDVARRHVERLGGAFAPRRDFLRDTARLSSELARTFDAPPRDFRFGPRAYALPALLTFTERPLAAGPLPRAAPRACRATRAGTRRRPRRTCAARPAVDAGSNP